MKTLNKRGMGIAVALIVTGAMVAPSAAFADTRSISSSETTAAVPAAAQYTVEELERELQLIASMTDEELAESVAATQQHLTQDPDEVTTQAVPLAVLIPALVGCVSSIATADLPSPLPEGLDLALTIAEIVVDCVPGTQVRSLANLIWDNRVAIGRALAAVGLPAAIVAGLCGDTTCD